MRRRHFARVNRRAQRKDANEPSAIVVARAGGAHVEYGECWDLWICLWRGGWQFPIVFPCEVKDGSKPPSKRKLTDREIGFARRWPGPGAIVKSNDEMNDALAAAWRGQLPMAREAADRYRDETEPGWRQREAVALADEVLG